MPAPPPPPPKPHLLGGSRLALTGAALNAALALVKISAGLLGNSYALIADGIESTLDIFSSLLIWAGLRFASLPPDESHPYGHGKAETLAAIATALLLLGTSVLLAVQSIREIQSPHHTPATFTLVVLLVVILSKELLFRRMLYHSTTTGSQALESDAWHHRADAITSLAAFLGISIALLGGKNFESADNYAALVACGVIAFNGIRILGPALNEAMDSAPSPHIEEAVRAASCEVAGVAGLEKCRVRKMGIEFYVDLHVLVDGQMPVYQGHAIAHAVKDAVRSRIPAIADVLVHIEPFGADPQKPLQP
jgi:cation diffusion facilitator family transporter